jgi:hypothetical protein
MNHAFSMLGEVSHMGIKIDESMCLPVLIALFGLELSL